MGDGQLRALGYWGIEARVSREYGKLYDELFEARQRGDYIELTSFEGGQVEVWLRQAEKFVKTIKSLIKTV